MSLQVLHKYSLSAVTNYNVVGNYNTLYLLSYLIMYLYHTQPVTHHCPWHTIVVFIVSFLLQKDNNRCTSHRNSEINIYELYSLNI